MTMTADQLQAMLAHVAKAQQVAEELQAARMKREIELVRAWRAQAAKSVDDAAGRAIRSAVMRDKEASQPSAVAMAKPASPRGVQVFCQSQYDPDE